MTVDLARAAVQEIFSGIQGEGMQVGLRQVFVRFHGCALHCRYCDTPAARGPVPTHCQIETHAGRRAMLVCPNPLDAEAIVAAVRRLEDSFPHHSVSLTGGEPLHHLDLLRALLPALHAAGLHSYLETNGQLPDALAALVTLPDFIAMDVKLPSLVDGGLSWASQTTFLQLAAARLPDPVAQLQVKIVFGEGNLGEIARAASLIAACRADMPTILQPLTAHVDGPPAPGPRTVLEAQRIAAAYLSHVRVIPQTHVMLGQW